MRITLSCARSAVNFGFDKSAANQLLNGQSKFIVKYDRGVRSLIVTPNDKGFAAYSHNIKNSSITYLTVRGGVAGYQKHDKIVLLDGSIKNIQMARFQ